MLLPFHYFFYICKYNIYTYVVLKERFKLNFINMFLSNIFIYALYVCFAAIFLVVFDIDMTAGVELNDEYVKEVEQKVEVVVTPNIPVPIIEAIPEETKIDNFGRFETQKIINDKESGIKEWNVKY